MKIDTLIHRYESLNADLLSKIGSIVGDGMEKRDLQIDLGDCIVDAIRAEGSYVFFQYDDCEDAWYDMKEFSTDDKLLILKQLDLYIRQH